MFNNLCSGVGARKELAEFVKQNGVKQYECGSGRPRDLLNYVVKNEVAAFDVTEKMGVYDGGTISVQQSQVVKGRLEMS